MRHLILLLLSYVALVLDAGAATWSLPAGTSPQFLFLVAAIALLLCDGTGAVMWAVIIGVLSDCLTPGPMGLNVVLLANLTFFAQVFGTHQLRDSVFASAAVIWGFVTLASLGSLILQSLLAGTVIDWAYLSQYAGGRAGGSTVIFLAIMLSWRLLGRSARLVLPSVKVGGDRSGWATPGA